MSWQALKPDDRDAQICTWRYNWENDLTGRIVGNGTNSEGFPTYRVRWAAGTDGSPEVETWVNVNDVAMVIGDAFGATAEKGTVTVNPWGVLASAGTGGLSSSVDEIDVEEIVGFDVSPAGVAEYRILPSNGGTEYWVSGSETIPAEKLYEYLRKKISPLTTDSSA